MKVGGDDHIFFLEERKHEIRQLDHYVFYECRQLIVIYCSFAVVEQECVQHTQHRITFRIIQEYF